MDGRSGGGSEKRNERFRKGALETATTLESEGSSPSSEVVEYDASIGAPSRKELRRQWSSARRAAASDFARTHTSSPPLDRSITSVIGSPAASAASFAFSRASANCGDSRSVRFLR